MSSNELDPETFINLYGPDTPVVTGKMELTLSKALEFEKMFCPADDESRQDPAKRLSYLAGMLATAGSLKPEHEYLIEDKE